MNIKDPMTEQRLRQAKMIDPVYTPKHMNKLTMWEQQNGQIAYDTRQNGLGATTTQLNQWQYNQQQQRVGTGNILAGSGSRQLNLTPLGSNMRVGQARPSSAAASGGGIIVTEPIDTTPSHMYPTSPVDYIPSPKNNTTIGTVSPPPPPPPTSGGVMMPPPPPPPSVSPPPMSTNTVPSSSPPPPPPEMGLGPSPNSLDLLLSIDETRPAVENVLRLRDSGVLSPMAFDVAINNLLRKHSEQTAQS